VYPGCDLGSRKEIPVQFGKLWFRRFASDFDTPFVSRFLSVGPSDWSAREVANEIDADSGLLRRAWTGRNDNAVRLHYLNVGDCNLIVPANLNLGAEFPEILNEVVGKRIVIVENEDQWNTQLLDYHRVEDRVASEAN